MSSRHDDSVLCWGALGTYLDPNVVAGQSLSPDLACDVVTTFVSDQNIQTVL